MSQSGHEDEVKVKEEHATASIDSPEETLDVEPEQSPRSVHGWRWILVCFSLYVSSFLYGLDTTIAADVQGAIIESFGNVSALAWVGTGFPLGSVSMTLIIGASYNRFDMKWLYLVSFITFEAASALCGAAPTMDVLIVGRVIAGMGGSGIYLGVLNYLSVCTSDRERGGYIAGIGFIWGLGSILGPVIGGAFSSSSATWRWAFYINLVIAAVCAPIYLLYLPNVPQQADVPFLKKLRSFDVVGAVLWAGFINAFTLVTTFAGTQWPWDDGRTIATWIVFGVLLVLFIIQQRYTIFTTRDNRVFPGHLLSSRSQILLYMGTAATTTNLFVPAYYIPLYFQFTHGDTAIEAAVRLLPFVLVLIAINMVSGVLLPRIGYYWIMYLITGVFMTIGGALMITVKASTAAGAIYGYTVIIAIGSGLTIQTGYAVATLLRAQAGFPEDITNVVALQNTAQLGSTLISLVISGQVFQTYAYNGIAAVLAGRGYTSAQTRDAVSGTQSAVFNGLSPQLKSGAVSAVTAAIDKVWILSLVGGVLVLVIAPFMKKERLLGLKATAGG